MRISKNELNKRLNKLISWLEEHKLSTCLVQDSVNLFYYTGLHISTGLLFVSSKKTTLIVDNRYYDRCKREVPMDVVLTKVLSNTLKEWRWPQKVGVDSHTTLLKDFELYKEFCDPISYPGFLSKLRMIKDTKEANLIHKSCQLTKRGMDYIQRHFKEGITEKELAQKLELFFKKEGAEKMAFDPIVAFGKNAANPHYTPSNVKLKKNDLILIDCGCVLDDYYSDMTRTFIKGKISDKMTKLIEICKKAQKKAVSICKPGVKLEQLNEVVHTIFKEEGVDELFIHSLGHGVGLEVHESPTLSSKEMVLEKGMVITIEPGLYVPLLGGVRIEDTLLITSNGYESLTS